MTRSAALLLSVCIAATLLGCGPQPAAGAASAAATPRRECFNARQVNSFNAINDEFVDVRVGARRYFRLQLTGVCPNIDWTQRVALRTTGGSSWICRGMDAELIVPSPGIGPERCLVTNVRPLSDAEARAMRYYK